MLSRPSRQLSLRLSSPQNNEPSSYYERLQAKDDMINSESTRLSDKPTQRTSASSSKASTDPSRDTSLLDPEDNEKDAKSNAMACVTSGSTKRSSKSTLISHGGSSKLATQQQADKEQHQMAVELDGGSLVGTDQPHALGNPIPRLVSGISEDMDDMGGVDSTAGTPPAQLLQPVDGLHSDSPSPWNTVTSHDEVTSAANTSAADGRSPHLPEQQQQLSQLPQAQIIDSASSTTPQSHPTITDVERQAIREEAEARTRMRLEAIEAVATRAHHLDANKDSHGGNGRNRNGGYTYDDHDGENGNIQQGHSDDRRRRMLIFMLTSCAVLSIIVAVIVGLVFGLLNDSSNSSSPSSSANNNSGSGIAPTHAPSSIQVKSNPPTPTIKLHPLYTDQPTAFQDPCPSNNRCECARDIELGNISTSLWGSTAKAGIDPVNTCDGITRNGMGVWYRVQMADNSDTGNQATRNKSLSLLSMSSSSSSSSNVPSSINRRMMASLCGSSFAIDRTNQTISIETDYDSQLSIFSGDRCDRLSCIAGNDQGGGDCDDRSQAVFVLDQQTTYYVYVHGFRSSHGTFSLEISEMPDNVDCRNAIDITSTRSAVGSTKGANVAPSALGTCLGFTSTAPGVWYKLDVGFTYPSGLPFSFFAQPIAGGFLPYVNVYLGNNCGELVCIGSDSPQLIFQITAGATYYVLVHGPGHSVGDFSIDFGFPNTGDPPPPPDKLCEDARSLPVGSRAKEFMFGLTTEVDPVASCGNDAIIETKGEAISIYRGAWFNTTGMGTVLRASTCNLGTGVDTRISILTGRCANLRCIDANDDRSQTFNVTASVLDDATSTSCSTVEWFAESGVGYHVLAHMPIPKSSGVDATVVVSLDEVEPALGAATTCEKSRPMPIDDTAVIGTSRDVLSSVTGTPGSQSEAAGIPCLSESADGADSQSSYRLFWYSLVGDGQRMTASTCHPGSKRDESTATAITVLATTTDSCNDLQCLSRNEVTEIPCQGHMSTTWQSIAGETYRLMVQMHVLQDPTAMAAEADARSGQSFAKYSTEPNSTDGNNTNNDVKSFALTVEPVVLNDNCQSAIGPVPLDGNSRHFTTRSATSSSSVDGSSFATDPQDYSTNPHLYSSSHCHHNSNTNNSGNGSNSYGGDGHATWGDSVGDGTTVNGIIHRPANGRDAWFTVLGNGYELVASTCSLYTQFPTRLSLYTGDECHSLACADSMDGDVSGNEEVSIVVSTCHDAILSKNPLFNPIAQTRGGYMRWKSRKDALYFIRIAGYDVEKDYGVVDFRVAPSNERCNWATWIDVQPPLEDGAYRTVTIEGTTEGAQPQEIEFERYLFDSSPAVWYEIKGVGQPMFASTCYTSLSVAASTATPSTTNVLIHEPSIVTPPSNLTDCDGLHPLSSVESVACGLHNTVSWYAVKGKTYHAVVRSFGLPFQLDVGVYDGHSCIGAMPLDVHSDDVQVTLNTSSLHIEATNAEDARSSENPGQSMLESCNGDWRNHSIGSNISDKEETDGSGRDALGEFRLWKTYFYEYEPAMLGEQDASIMALVSTVSNAICLPSLANEAISRLQHTQVYFSVSIAQGSCATGWQCLNTTTREQSRQHQEDQEAGTHCDVEVSIPAATDSPGFAGGEAGHRIAIHFFGFGDPAGRNITDIQHSVSVDAKSNSPAT